MNKLIFALVSLLLFSGIQLPGQSKWSNPDNPVELGQISWLRDYDKAIALSNEKDLPVLILFQEVPGCSTCTTYGFEVLSHPFIVEMIETHFIPLAIFNNKGGHDRKILKKYGEPTWNNPVVRIVNSEGNDLVSRLSGDFSAKGLSSRITSALSLSGQVEPTYFSIWRKELDGTNRKEEAYLSMYCFWTGEKEIAKIDGVLSTEAGFMHGREVVKVEYDEQQTDLSDIVDQAKKAKCADHVYVKGTANANIADKKPGRYRVDKEVKYYLSKSKYQYIPMTPLQAAKVNSFIGERRDPAEFLSPRQQALLVAATGKKSYINQDFASSWYEAIESFY